MQINLETSDNVYFYKELFSKFLKRKPEIPLCQRSYVEERISHFYDQLDSKQNNDELPYIGIIHCALYKQDQCNKVFIVDGQHRFYAYKRFYETHGKDFYVQNIMNLLNINGLLAMDILKHI